MNKLNDEMYKKFFTRLVMTQKITAIRIIQHELGCGLREAKNIADQIYEEEDQKRDGMSCNGLSDCDCHLRIIDGV